MTQNCGQCAFWEGANRKVGECHRYPPHASGPSMTREFDWCGEFEQHQVNDPRDMLKRPTAKAPQVPSRLFTCVSSFSKGGECAWPGETKCPHTICAPPPDEAASRLGLTRQQP